MADGDINLNSDEILNRGRNAENLLNNPTLNELFEEMLNETSIAFMASEPGDKEAREGLYHHAQAIAALREKIHDRLNSAVMEAGKLSRQNRKH